MTHKNSVVVATKDRPDDLRRLLESLHRQTIPPAEVVIVDVSREPVEPVVAASLELHPIPLVAYIPSFQDAEE
jgi:GT2 family glycosyltransferase